MATDCVVERCCQCGNQYQTAEATSRYDNFFCSTECSYEFKRHFGGNRDCTCCGKQIWCIGRKFGQEKVFCGNECLSAFRKAKREAKQRVPKERKPRVSKGHMTYGEWWPAWKRLRGKGYVRPDPWYMKLAAIAKGWRDRKEDIQRPRRDYKKSVPCTNWRSAIVCALAKAKAKQARADKKAKSPWWLKFETVARNWNQKRLLAEWNQDETCSTAINAGVTGVQMRVEWSGLNA